jgi:crotonobetainyl-CoA:carnitine CoA-transferase CaiB-like acyl-CoA transferase
VEEKFWQSLCEAVGASDISRYRNAGEEKMQEARSRLSEIFKTKTRDDWFTLLRDKDVCVAPVKTLDEVFSDPQVRHRSMVFEMDRPGLGRIKQLGFPVKYSEAQQDLRAPPPMLGEHTESVLVELGYTRDQIQQFAEEGVL